MTPLWIAKHQARLPAALVTFFSLTAENDSTALQDNILKSEIANVKNVLNSTNYKTKLVVVLVGEESITSSSLEDRLAVLRRFAALDAKSLYFLPFGSSQVEVGEFVRHILLALNPICIEYYRDLSKKARRKRNRSSVPPPTVPPPPNGPSAIAAAGWNVRYEFKLAVFAEFRQEMDAACRNYETAYQSLFTGEIPMSNTEGSHRMQEARLLADVIALRTIRCHLWIGQTTAAVRSWKAHRDRMEGLFSQSNDRMGTSSWEMWRSTWSKTMADLITRAEFSSLIKGGGNDSQNSVFAPADRTVALGEKIAPWEQLHHEGYWLRKAERHLRLAKGSGSVAPEADKLAFSGSGPEEKDSIVSLLQLAIVKYSGLPQKRAVSFLTFREAQEYILSHVWDEALLRLKPLWEQASYRQSGWWDLFQEIGDALRICAEEVQDLEFLAQIEWELNSLNFRKELATRGAGTSNRRNSSPDKIPLVLSADKIISPVMASFAFHSAEGNAGEPSRAQLTLQSNTLSDAIPFQISEIKVVFEGSLKPLHIVMGEDASGYDDTIAIRDVKMSDSSTVQRSKNRRSSTSAISSLLGTTNLTIQPSQTRVFNMLLTPREAGELRVASITLSIDVPKASLTMITSRFDHPFSYWWDIRHGRLSSRRLGMERNATTMIILPKPPKLAISAPALRQTYYTNERVRIRLQVDNDEEEPTSGNIVCRLISPLPGSAALRWGDEEEQEPQTDLSQSLNLLLLSARDFSSLASKATKEFEVVIYNTVAALDHELEVAVTYSLQSDPETPLVKNFVAEIPVMRPFEANYEFVARLDLETWPSFFAVPPKMQPDKAEGLKQRFSVQCSVCSFTNEPVVIEDASPRVHEVTEGVICDTDPDGDVAEKMDRLIRPEETQSFPFELVLRKLKLGDRNSANVDLALDIRWRRQDSQETCTTSLEVPRFFTPMAEPRVLLTVQKTGNAPAIANVFNLLFTMENPSMHYLTFNIGMDSSEDFAFSGPKSSMVSVTPISRHTVPYRILCSKNGEWIRVNLTVVDAYFGKTLHVQPAGEGVKMDKKGNVFVLID